MSEVRIMNKKFKDDPLPDGWAWTTLGELGIVVSGGTPSTDEPEFWNDEIPWITPADLSNYKNKYISRGRRNISQMGLDYSSAVLVPKGSLLFSSRAPIGYIVIAQNDLSTNQGFKNLIPTNHTYVDYLYYFLQSASQEILAMAKGTTFLELSASSFSQIRVPLPPFKLQFTIVEKIEEIFSKLDSCIEDLSIAKKQLGLYRQAILKSAFEKTSTSNKNPKENRIKKNNEWKIIKLQDITEVISDGDHQPPPKVSNGVPFITISNINKKSNQINFDSTFYVSDEYYNNLKEHKRPVNGDILYTVTGSFGIPVLIDFDKNFCFQRHIALIRPLKTINSKWLYYLLQSPQLVLQGNLAATGTAQKTVGLNSLRNFEILLCPEDQQELIVQELERKLTTCDKLENYIDDGIKQIANTKLSVFNRAFNGNLVSNDFIDESAVELLNKIRVEKEHYFDAQKVSKKYKVKRKTMADKNQTIVKVLESFGGTMEAKDVWEKSEHKADIEEFYAALKKLEGKVFETKKGVLSLSK